MEIIIFLVILCAALLSALACTFLEVVMVLFANLVGFMMCASLHGFGRAFEQWGQIHGAGQVERRHPSDE